MDLFSTLQANTSGLNEARRGSSAITVRRTRRSLEERYVRTVLHTWHCGTDPIIKVNMWPTRSVGGLAGTPQRTSIKYGSMKRSVSCSSSPKVSKQPWMVSLVAPLPTSDLASL